MDAQAHFPVWLLSGPSGGLLIAVIAVIHVFVAQFAVGGGFFLVSAERMGHKEGSRSILKWVHGHTRFFLLLTMVFGSITGVGIWLVISLVNPAGVAVLVDVFLYAWAAEWVFFLCEIITLLLYAASFAACREGRMHPSDHMALGLAYCLFAFLSLFTINAIISFMLTPGDWLENKNFWSAFFNPGFWPSLFFRFCLCLLLSGFFGLLTAVRIKSLQTRTKIIKFCAFFICLPFVCMVIAAIWYTKALPPELQGVLGRGTADLAPFLKLFLTAAPWLFVVGVLLFIRFPPKMYYPLIGILFVLCFSVAGAFEWVRETARRPYLIYGYLYSNGISLTEGAKITKIGALAYSGWARLRAMPPDEFNAASAAESLTPGPADSGNSLTAPVPAPETLSAHGKMRYGEYLYAWQCSGCHGINAPLLDLGPRLKYLTRDGIFAFLAAQGEISPYMPPFFGNADDRKILAAWLALQTQRAEAKHAANP